MNLESIIIYLKNIENENIILKEKTNIYESTISELHSNITDFSKFSIITNINKQLKDKIVYIDIMEKQLDKLKKINNEQELKIFAVLSFNSLLIFVIIENLLKSVILLCSSLIVLS